MTPGDVLRKGSGTLCETLLQARVTAPELVGQCTCGKSIAFTCISMASSGNEAKLGFEASVLILRFSRFKPFVEELCAQISTKMIL